MKLLLLLGVSFFLIHSSIVYAAEEYTAYQNKVEIPAFQISEPTVVELEFLSDVNDVIVIENQTQTMQPTIQRLEEVPDTKFSIETSYGNASALVDTNRDTYVDYPVSNQGNNETVLNITFDQPTTINGVFLEFSDFSRSPDSIKIHTYINGTEQIILNSNKYTSPVIRFPARSVTNIALTISHTQPIRLTRVGTYEVKNQIIEKKLVRFLAKSGQTYTAYLNADRKITTTTPQAGNLFQETNPLRFSFATTTANPEYIESDSDSDGVPDKIDNCPQIANQDQSDSNKNGVGDVCDDTDFDTIINSIDNCPEHANFNQSDVDGDGIGDVCDDEESRFTEQYPWLPWIAMGGTALIISVLVFQMSKSKAFQEETPNTPPQNLE